MRHIMPLVMALVLGAVPAWAQQGGLPVTQAQVNALQSQIDLLQGSLLALQKRVDGLSSLIGWDDGTADALAGMWSGSARSIEFDRAVAPNLPSGSGQLFFNIIFGGSPNGPTANFTVPLLGPCPGGIGLCQTGNTMVGVNPDMWLGRSSAPSNINLRIIRDGLKLSGEGTATDQQPPPNPPTIQNFTLTGITLSNNFFLLKIRVPVPAGATGPCVPSSGFVVFQGIGSLNPNRSGMSFTGSAVDFDCRHTIFRVGLTKQ